MIPPELKFPSSYAVGGEGKTFARSKTRGFKLVVENRDKILRRRQDANVATHVIGCKFREDCQLFVRPGIIKSGRSCTTTARSESR